METVTLTDVYRELRRVRKELHELRESMIPVEDISEEERRTLDRTFKEMEEGNETPWRKVRAKRPFP